MDQDKQERINDLKAERADIVSQLTSPYSGIGDWKLAKQEEAILLKAQTPYTEAEMKEYGDARAAARARINAIDEELKELEK